jgi:hypothetical protein
MAQAMAMKNGLILANTLGCNAVVAKSDSLDTIESYLVEQTWWTMPAAIYADCVDLATSIGDVSFKFCPREANKTIHELVRQCFTSKISCNWENEPPNFLLNNFINNIIIVDN